MPSELGDDWRGDVVRKVADHLEFPPKEEVLAPKLAPVQSQNVLVEKDGLGTCHGLVEFSEQLPVQFHAHVAASHPHEPFGQCPGTAANFQNRVRRLQLQSIYDLLNRVTIVEEMLAEALFG